ncbi:MAG: radical SAM protein [candidate division Zixibacteria bacterium]|nr:radical SAM protein [candidate division Zixibacteria bacterium]
MPIAHSIARTLERERGTIIKPAHPRSVRIALVFPNTYYVGMSNLGFQTIYRHLNARSDVVCERAFLPDPEDAQDLIRSRTPLFTYESGIPLAQCDIVAFSISFENDYPNLIRILELARIPLFAQDRTHYDPIVLIGGAVTYINPEPLADFADIMIVGDGEEASYRYIDRYIEDRKTLRSAHLERAADMRGIYVPAHRIFNGDDHNEPTSDQIEKQQVARFEDYPAYSGILTPDTEFGETLLIEISRGCPRRCRFCAVSYVYPKFRAHTPETILSVIRSENERLVRDGHPGIRSVGLVSSAMCDYPYLNELCAGLDALGMRVGVSSVRVDLIPDSLLDLMLKTGLRTMTIAPEAGSERLRKAINKPMSSEAILTGAQRILSRGIQNLKLYYMVGLPTETDEDIEELIDMTRRLSNLQRAEGLPGGRLRLSINPFVPKALTPFQWSPMAKPGEIKRKLDRITSALRRTPGVTVKHESLKSAYFEAVLSRGGRELSAFLVETVRRDGDWKAAAAEIGLDMGFYLGDMSQRSSLPWDFISTDREQHRLRWEYRKSHGLPYRELTPVVALERPPVTTSDILRSQ